MVFFLTQMEVYKSSFSPLVIMVQFDHFQILHKAYLVSILNHSIPGMSEISNSICLAHQFHHLWRGDIVVNINCISHGSLFSQDSKIPTYLEPVSLSSCSLAALPLFLDIVASTSFSPAAADDRDAEEDRMLTWIEVLNLE